MEAVGLNRFIALEIARRVSLMPSTVFWLKKKRHKDPTSFEIDTWGRPYT